jgi:integrase
MDSANWRKRILQPAAKLAGLRVNFQMLRRTVATLSIQAGVTVKAVQAQLRHASAETTMNVYAQVVTAAQGEAAEKMFRLMKPRKPATDTKCDE